MPKRPGVRVQRGETSLKFVLGVFFLAQAECREEQKYAIGIQQKPCYPPAKIQMSRSRKQPASSHQGFSEQPAIFGRAVTKVMKNRRFSTGEYEIPGFSPVFLASQAYLAHQRQQAFARQPQVGQRKQRQDLPSVLGETTIANLRIAELPLDDLERVFLIHAIKPFSLQRGQQHRAGICS